MMICRLNERFNTQPPEGGWCLYYGAGVVIEVSTHSRLKAAGNIFHTILYFHDVSTHSRLKAAGVQGSQQSS